MTGDDSRIVDLGLDWEPIVIGLHAVSFAEWMLICNSFEPVSLLWVRLVRLVVEERLSKELPMAGDLAAVLSLSFFGLLEGSNLFTLAARI